MENLENRLDKIAGNIQQLVNIDSKTNNKISSLESKFNKIQNLYLRPDLGFYEDTEYKNAFNDFIRKGVETDLIKKSFTSANDEGGAMITSSLQHKIISAMTTKSPMRQIASIETISTNALDLIIEDGKFASGWIGENEARIDSTVPKLKKKTISVCELYAQPKATQRLIDDAEINIENWLAERLADSFAREEHEAFIVGDGSKKPFGLLSNKDIKTVNATDAVDVEVLLKMINSLGEEFLSNATFLMNRNTLSSIQGLKDKNDRFIWQQSLSDPLKQTIFGIPVVCSSYMPDVATDKLSIALGDFKEAYKIVDRSSINIMRDPYTEKPFVKFYAIKRVGGDVVNPNAALFAKFA